MSKQKIKKSTYKVILIVLGCILLIGAVIGLVSLFGEKGNEKQTTLSTNIYSVGGLTEQGSYLETSSSIYTKELIGCIGLKTELVFDNSVSYRIFFYDKEEKYLSSTGKLTGDFNNAPDFAKYCRIVITPNEDKNIKWYEVKGYAKQLTVNVDKKQVFAYENNLFVADSSKDGHTAPNIGESMLTAGSALENCSISETFEVKSYSKLVVFVPNKTICKYTNLIEGNASHIITKKTVKTIDVDDSGDLVKIEFDLSAGTEYAQIVYGRGCDIQIYGIK